MSSRGARLSCSWWTSCVCTANARVNPQFRPTRTVKTSSVSETGVFTLDKGVWRYPRELYDSDGQCALAELGQHHSRSTRAVKKIKNKRIKQQVRFQRPKRGSNRTARVRRAPETCRVNPKTERFGIDRSDCCMEGRYKQKSRSG